MNYSEHRRSGVVIARHGGIGTFLVRFSFLGLIGNRDLPPWLLRHLRYTPVAVFPALVGAAGALAGSHRRQHRSPRA